MVKENLKMTTIMRVKFITPITTLRYRPGVVAYSCNPATWRSGLRTVCFREPSRQSRLCRSGVRTKLGINMVLSGEPRRSRLSKEERISPGWWHSRQKFPCRAVVGSRPWTGVWREPDCMVGLSPFSRFIIFLFFFLSYFICFSV